MVNATLANRDNVWCFLKDVRLDFLQHVALDGHNLVNVYSTIGRVESDGLVCWYDVLFRSFGKTTPLCEIVRTTRVS